MHFATAWVLFVASFFSGRLEVPLYRLRRYLQNVDGVLHGFAARCPAPDFALARCHMNGMRNVGGAPAWPITASCFVATS
jgi:hypothetical protein